ncbi:MAG: response regulator [Sphingomonas bacterium]|nr:response regulator [Sphingomonas bacterium]
MSKTALIVEDEIFVALDLERILTDAGYKVAGIAADSDAAMASAPGCEFAFVDVNLRDGSTGPDIARRMMEDHGIKVVFVTANPAQIGTLGTCSTGLGGAALGYIRKPFTDQSIRAAAALASDPGCGIDHRDIIRLPM